MAEFEISWSDMPDEAGVAESYKFRFDNDTLSVKEAREVKKQTEMNPPQWLNELAEDDPEAMTALVLLLRRRAGEDKLRWDDVEFNARSIRYERLNVEDVEAEPDPPVAASE